MTQTTVNANGEAVQTFGKPPIPVKDVVDEAGNTYCQVHPDRETGLRCNNCTRLMCPKCAVHTPVGYRCQQCVRERENRFFNADASYYAILFGASVFGGTAGSFIASLFGWFIIFTFFIAAIAGGMIAELALRLTKGKRGRYAAPVVAGGVVVGVLVFAGISTFMLLNQSAAAIQAQLAAEVGAQQAAELMAQYRQRQFSAFLPTLFSRFFGDFRLLIFAGVAAFVVYGRLNIYGK